ncbi:MAG: TldD/PmbA family protein [Bryobacteraceae bacterium]
MLTREQAQSTIEKILSYSKFPECEVSVREPEEAYIRFANNSITTSGIALERTITIRSTRDGKTGSANVTSVDDAELKATVARSEEIAAITPANPEHVAPLGPQEYPKLDKFDLDTASARTISMVPHVRAVIDTASGKKLVAAGLIRRVANVSAIGNKKGLFGYHRGADARMSATIRKPDGSSSGWDSQQSLHLAQINGASLAERASGKCLAWQKPQRLEPGKYTVVLEGTATGDLVRLLAFSFAARGADEGRTFLSKRGGGTRLGEKMFPEIITLRTDPFDARLPGTPWGGGFGGGGGGGGGFGGGGGGGVPARKMTWIENGVVRNLFYDRYWAERSKKEPSPFPGDFVLEGGDSSLDDLIAPVDRGLLVTRFWYIRSLNPQTVQFTGLTRDGLFLIEKGKVTTAVVNFRFNESPVRLLQNTTKLGRASRVQGGEGASMIAPPLVAIDFNFASVSDAV